MAKKRPQTTAKRPQPSDGAQPRALMETFRSSVPASPAPAAAAAATRPATAAPPPTR